MFRGSRTADIQVWNRLAPRRCGARLLADDRELIWRNFEPNDARRCVVGPLRLLRPG
jgi:hypothetical protein